MTENELRTLVRDVIARQMPIDPARAADRVSGTSAPAASHHPSHAMFMVQTGSDGDGPCLIEPAVICNHCGYCRSYGH